MDEFEEEPSGKLPVMYRRQTEISDGSLVFHGRKEDPAEQENPAKVLRQKKLAKARKFGQMLTVVNFVLLIVLFTVFKAGDFSQTGDGDFTINARAVLTENRIHTSLSLAFKHGTSKREGELVEVWLWIADDKVLPKPAEIIVPANAIRLIDVLPMQAHENRIWSEQFAVPNNGSIDRLRFNALIEQNGRRYAVQATIGRE